jgi:CTP:molybdopterin cytidylyltransferase MocA
LEPRERELRRRGQLIVTWCDRHLVAVHALATLMTDQPAVVAEAMAQVLAAPDEACIAGPRPWHKHGDHGLPSRQCPADASPLDRLELALYLLGDRTCVAVARALGLPEHVVTARLLGELGVLLAPCDSLATIPALGRSV